MRRELDPMAKRRLGVTKKALTRDRIDESPLADALTDAFRQAAGTEIAFLNTGGLRADIAAGPLTYESLFEVLPFANRGVKIGPMKLEKLLALLRRSVLTCGGYGALMQSGLRVTFSRDCRQASNGVDAKADLVRVETVGGEVVYDAALAAPAPDPDREFLVATLDFLAAGGSGYGEFKGVPLVEDLGIVREALVKEMLTHPVSWSGDTDGRWKRLPQK
jgi:5'-nucleotidase